MMEFRIGDWVRSDYGAGRILAITSQWIIHDDIIRGSSTQFAISLNDDEIELITPDTKFI